MSEMNCFYCFNFISDNMLNKLEYIHITKENNYDSKHPKKYPISACATHLEQYLLSITFP